MAFPERPETGCEHRRRQVRVTDDENPHLGRPRDCWQSPSSSSLNNGWLCGCNTSYAQACASPIPMVASSCNPVMTCCKEEGSSARISSTRAHRACANRSGLIAAAALGAGSASSKQKAAAAAGHYTFVVSNNFLGNDYRPELLKEAQLVANDPPFKGHVTVKIVESQPTAAAQLADLNNVISEHPNAILVEPPDPTSINPAIKRACDAGIIVIDVDQSSTEPCAYTVSENFYTAQYVLGEWMASELHGKGSIFIDEGLPGPDISKTILNGFEAGLKASGPNIKIAGHYSGQFADAPSQQAVSSLLVGNKNVNGIMNDGYCTPVFNALKSAGVKPVPTTCYAYNGEMEAAFRSTIRVRCRRVRRPASRSP